MNAEELDDLEQKAFRLEHRLQGVVAAYRAALRYAVELEKVEERRGMPTRTTKPSPELWRTESGEVLILEHREPEVMEVIYNAYSADNHYLGPMSEGQLKRNGFERVEPGLPKEEK